MRPLRAQVSALRAPLYWLSGPIIWAAHLLLVYASESIFCSRGAGAEAHFLFVVVVSTAAVAPLCAMLMRAVYANRFARTGGNAGTAFMNQAAFGLSLLSLIGVLWAAVPAMVLTACVSPS